MPGLFITLEGGEGAGKSTIALMLEDHLTKLGRTVVVTREPGGSPGAESIRQLLVTGDGDRWDALSETLLLIAARRDHVTTVIGPAIKQGKVVICDRFTDSTAVYQGMVKGVPTETIDELHRLAGIDMTPDMTLVLDLPASLGLQRTMDRQEVGSIGGPEDRFERMDLAFHEALRQGFLALAAREKGRVIVVDASKPITDVFENVVQIIQDRLTPMGAGA